MPCRLVPSVKDHVTAEPQETLLPAVDVVEGIIAMKNYADFQWVYIIQDKCDFKAVKMVLFMNKYETVFYFFAQSIDRRNRLN